jgi:hypothetical protein
MYSLDFGRPEQPPALACPARLASKALAGPTRMTSREKGRAN